MYGAYDIGVGWVSHGLPENGYNYEGESLVNRNGYQHRFLIAPNNLQQTGFGIRGKEQFLPGWFVVFNASSGINPQSGLLANASKTDIINNGLPGPAIRLRSTARGRGKFSMTNTMAGYRPRSLARSTFGRERSLGTDVMLAHRSRGGQL